MVERTRWQYRLANIGTFNTPARLATILSRLGAEGWELVHVYDKASNWLAGTEKGIVLFKRAVPPGEEPDGPWAIVLDKDGEPFVEQDWA